MQVLFHFVYYNFIHAASRPCILPLVKCTNGFIEWHTTFVCYVEKPV
jgi:hypothetical protein